ncbi:MAG: AraC family transcriptional regulator [Terracidiphilus sp.]
MDRRIETAVRIIRTEIHRNVPVHELAQQVRLSTSHFIRLFKAETSFSPKQYVRCLRMEQAEALLNDSFLSVKEIAASLGVGDRSHFSRDFKKQFGSAPANFRDRDQSRENDGR